MKNLKIIIAAIICFGLAGYSSVFAKNQFCQNISGHTYTAQTSSGHTISFTFGPLISPPVSDHTCLFKSYSFIIKIDNQTIPSTAVTSVDADNSYFNLQISAGSESLGLDMLAQGGESGQSFAVDNEYTPSTFMIDGDIITLKDGLKFVQTKS